MPLGRFYVSRPAILTQAPRGSDVNSAQLF
jgi:hypothetical protein